MVSFRLLDRKCSHDMIVTDVVHPSFDMDFFQDGWTEVFLMTMRGEAANANSCTKVLVRQTITRWGVPDIMTPGGESQFVSDLWLEVCRWMGIARDPTTIYHPQLNGNVERMHRCLKKLTTRQSAWPSKLACWVILGDARTACWGKHWHPCHAIHDGHWTTGGAVGSVHRPVSQRWRCLNIRQRRYVGGPTFHRVTMAWEE